MAIAFRAVGTTSKVASGNMSPGLPAGHVLNDILLLLTNQQDNVSCSVSGWTNISGGTANNGTNDRMELWAKRDNGSESAPTVTHASGGVSNAVIAAFSGVDSGLTIGTGAGAIFRDAQNQTGSNTTTFTAPALTGVVSGDMRIFAGEFTVNDTSGATTNNWGTVSGFTERLDDCSGLGGAWASSLGIDSLLASGSAGSITSAVGWLGAFTSWTWICSQLALSSDSSATLTLALTGASSTLSAGTVGVQIPVGPTAFQADAFQNDAFQIVTSDVSVALTGITSTLSPGTLTPSSTRPTTGISSTVSPGTVVANTSVAITGNASTLSVGSLTPSSTVAITGIASTASPGTVVQSHAVPVTGSASTVSVGTTAPSTTIGLTGITATGSPGNVSAGSDVSAALTGTATTLSVGSMVPSRAVPITGTTATTAVVSVTSSRTVATTGVATSTSAGSLTALIVFDLGRAGVTVSDGQMGGVVVADQQRGSVAVTDQQRGTNTSTEQQRGSVTVSDRQVGSVALNDKN